MVSMIGFNAIGSWESEGNGYDKRGIGKYRKNCNMEFIG